MIVDQGDNISKKDRIYFDDMSVLAGIYSWEPTLTETPADVVDQWVSGSEMNQDYKKVLVDLMCSNIRIAINPDRVNEACSFLETELLAMPEDSIETIIPLLGLWKFKCLTDAEKGEEIYARADRLMEKYRMDADEKLKDKWVRLSRRDRSAEHQYQCVQKGVPLFPLFDPDGLELISPKHDSAFRLRSEALDHLVGKRFEEAEKIYLHLIEIGFEVPGTYCHLARLYLLSNRDRMARKMVTRAWKLRRDAKVYAIPRILFFKIFFCLCGNTNPGYWIRKMKTILSDCDCTLNWDVNLTIEAVKPKLNAETTEFLVALSQVISGDAEKEIMLGYNLWKQSGKIATMIHDIHKILQK